MAKTKAVTENQEKAEQPLVSEQQAQTPSQYGGPSRVMRTASGPPPVADGARRLNRATNALKSADQELGSASRARMMMAMQRSVGNAWVSRMLSTPRIEEEQREGAGNGPASVLPGSPRLNLAVSHPASPEEKEAEAVASKVAAGNPAPRINPLNSGPVQKLGRDEGKEKDKGGTDSAPEEHEASPILTAPPREAAGAGHTRGMTTVHRALTEKGPGSPLDPASRRPLESRMGADLSQARIHRDSVANEAASALGARAFTQGHDVFMGRGESESDTHLMAHELTHVVQQTGGPSQASGVTPMTVSPLAEDKKGAAPVGPSKPAAATGADVAPGVMELKGKPGFEPPPEIASFLETHQEATVNVQFGALAQGPIKVSKDASEGYRIRKQAIRLTHPLFVSLGELPKDFEPSLIISLERERFEGYVGLGGLTKLSGKELQTAEKGADLLGLAGFSLDGIPAITNKLEEGSLHLGLKGIKISFGPAFDGTANLDVVDEKIAFEGTLNLKVKKLAKGTMELKRSAEGAVSGKATVGLDLPKNFSGNFEIVYDGELISGEAKVGHQGEKLSGEVTVKLMERGLADQLKREKQAPPAAEGAAKAGAPKAPGEGKSTTKAKKKPEYVIFGEGDLTFAFTEWLNGAAHVIVDHEGFLTVIGKITPQKEYVFLEQKDYVKQLFKVEARAAYGIPVVGNIFIFANVGMDAFAKLGPGKLYNIVVEGKYSTDPKETKNFSIQASLNVSAAAGLRLRGEAGAGLEILAHDIKAGAGVNGIVAIRGYADATPMIGYREKAKEGEDKKGEFFIRGDLEIAAQPFLGLSGDLFVEIDAPWWSPVPDKKWTWPLVNKEWPIGGSFGMLASVDYVFGSKEFPKIEFKPVDFSADKFFTDLYQDKAPPKSKEGGDQKGEWKEKNSPEAEPPKGGGKGELPPGKAAAEPPPAKSKVQPGGPKAPEKPVDPNAKTVEGKSVKELKDEATKKGKKPDGKEVAKGTGKEEGTDKAKGKEEHDEELKKGLAALDAVTERYVKDGATKEEVQTGVKAVRRKFKVFKSIEVIDGGETWDYEYVANPGKAKGPKKSKVPTMPSGLTRADPIPIKWFKRPELYVPSIELLRLGITINRDEPTRIPVGLTPGQELTIGVPPRYWPKIGKKMQYIPTERGNAVDQIRAVLDYYGLKRRELGVQMDHVQDLQFEGPDIPENVWPYDSSANMSAGPRQRDQEVTYLDEKTGTSKQAKTNELQGRWFVIVEIE